MPMKVHPSSAGDVTAAHIGHGAAALASLASPLKATTAHASAAAARSTKGTTFASVLAQSSTTASPGTDVKAKEIKARSGETLTPVAGHAYSAISGGSRDGMCINTSHNSRRGMAFVLVVKNGREYHIYGTGKDRLVVALRKPADSHKTDATNTASGAGTATGGTPTVSAS
jgi:hypothetical protein